MIVLKRTRQEAPNEGRNAMALDREELRGMLKTMITIREFELKMSSNLSSAGRSFDDDFGNAGIVDFSGCHSTHLHEIRKGGQGE